MALYSYKATTITGSLVEGAIEAVDEKSVIDKLRNSGLIPIKVIPPQVDSARRKLFQKSLHGNVLTFTSELAALLNAGVTLERGLKTLSDVSETEAMKEIILSMLNSIREGSTFHEALAKHPKAFSKVYVNMVRAGESGGVLDVIMNELAGFLESSKELQDHVVSAMIYPTILVFTSGGSIVILLTYVVPKFSQIFKDFGQSLPLPTKVLLAISGAMTDYWWMIALAIAAGIVFLRVSIRTKEGKYNWDAFKLKVMGDIIRKLETARFCRTLGILLRSGVPILPALNNVKDIVGNQVISNSIDDVSKGAKEGEGIAAPLAATGVFSPLVVSMIMVGEETGQLDKMLLKIASIYETSLKVSVKQFMNILEPAIILLMGIVVGFIVLSMLIAIFSVTEMPF